MKELFYHIEDADAINEARKQKDYNFDKAKAVLKTFAITTECTSFSIRDSGWVQMFGFAQEQTSKALSYVKKDDDVFFYKPNRRTKAGKEIGYHFGCEKYQMDVKTILFDILYSKYSLDIPSVNKWIIHGLRSIVYRPCVYVALHDKDIYLYIPLNDDDTCELPQPFQLMRKGDVLNAIDDANKEKEGNE